MTVMGPGATRILASALQMRSGGSGWDPAPDPGELCPWPPPPAPPMEPLSATRALARGGGPRRAGRVGGHISRFSPQDL